MDKTSQLYKDFNNNTDYLKKSINQLLFQNDELLKESSKKDFEIDNLKGILSNRNSMNVNDNNANNGNFRNSVNPNNNYDGSMDRKSEAFDKKSFMIYGTPQSDEYYENDINDRINNNNRLSNYKKKGILKNASQIKPRSTSLSNLVWRTDEDDEISSISSKDYNDKSSMRYNNYQDNENNGKDAGYISDSNSVTSISTLVNNEKYFEKQSPGKVQKSYSCSNNQNRSFYDNDPSYNNIRHSYSCVNPNVRQQAIQAMNDDRRSGYNKYNTSNGYDQNIIKIQSAFRGYQMRKLFMKIKSRKQVAIDLLKNEIQYVKNLLCLYKVL